MTVKHVRFPSVDLWQARVDTDNYCAEFGIAFSYKDKTAIPPVLTAKWVEMYSISSKTGRGVHVDAVSNLCNVLSSQKQELLETLQKEFYDRDNQGR